MGDAKINHRDYGIEQNWGLDDEIEEPLWEPSVISLLGEKHWDWWREFVSRLMSDPKKMCQRNCMKKARIKDSSREVFVL